jgi:hypothetical protein
MAYAKEVKKESEEVADLSGVLFLLFGLFLNFFRSFRQDIDLKPIVAPELYLKFTYT